MTLNPYSLRVGKLGLLLAVFVGGLITWEVISHKRAKQEQEERVRKEKREREDAAISNLANRYHAVIDWRRPFLKGVRFVSKVYSAELTPLLVRSDKRAILAIGSVRDVSAEEGAYSIQLLANVNLSSKVIFKLQADRDQVTQIMGRREQPALNSFMKWAVVAQISSVRSSELSESGDASGADEARSIAYGQCLDLAYLGAYFRDLLPERNPSQEPSP